MSTARETAKQFANTIDATARSPHVPRLLHAILTSLTVPFV